MISTIIVIGLGIVSVLYIIEYAKNAAQRPTKVGKYPDATTEPYDPCVDTAPVPNGPAYEPYNELYTQIPQSSVAGVAYDTEKNLWRVRFRVNGSRKHFGYFADQLEAEQHCLALRGSGHTITSTE